VKRITRRDRIFYCGHSMGGMLGYGYAGIHDDFEGLITIGAPADLGADFPLLRSLAVSGPALTAAIDLTLGAMNLEQRVSKIVGKAVADAVERFNPELAEEIRPGPVPRRRSYRYLPVDTWQRLAERLLARAEVHPLYAQAYQRMGLLANAQRVATQDIRWLLREGGERESRGVVDQFARWIRRREMVCYRTGYDFKRGFSKIRVPMAIIFGDMDPLASVESTRSVYRAARSDYLLWRPVKGNSHVELTMGHDIRQICYDIKNLMEYALTHRHRAPSLPRLR
jgi:pimeloyl-ACP methyl ester carboxylesterase